MHLADVGAVIARFVQTLDPALTPAIGVFQDPRCVRKIAFEQTGSRGGARSGCHVALLKRDAFADQPIQVRRFDVVESECRDRVIALLIGDDEDDVRALHGSARGENTLMA